MRAESKMEKQLKEHRFLHDQKPEDVYRCGNCDPRISAQEIWFQNVEWFHRHKYDILLT